MRNVCWRELAGIRCIPPPPHFLSPLTPQAVLHRNGPMFARSNTAALPMTDFEMQLQNRSSSPPSSQHILSGRSYPPLTTTFCFFYRILPHH